MVAATGTPVLWTIVASFALQAEAVQLLARQDHRALGLGDVLDRLGNRHGQRLRIARRIAGQFAGERPDLGGGHIARDLDIDGPAVVARRRQHALDLVGRGRRVVEHGLRHRELLEDAELGIEAAHRVVQERPAALLVRSRARR